MFSEQETMRRLLAILCEFEGGASTEQLARTYSERHHPITEDRVEFLLMEAERLDLVTAPELGACEFCGGAEHPNQVWCAECGEEHVFDEFALGAITETGYNCRACGSPRFTTAVAIN